jgi:hypothetical protein
VTPSPAAGAFRSGRDVWSEREVSVKGRVVEARVEGRDAAVIRLEQ